MGFVVEDEVVQKKENSIWVEKYRPSNMDGYVCSQSTKEFFQKLIQKKDIPHLLLHGPAGTGKTTLAKVLVNNIPCDYIYINASAENGIENVRERLKYFAMGAGFKPLKVVILDEADFLSQAAQAGLRNMTEAYSQHTRFIFTCNYPEKMMAAIVSRCQTFEIKPISKKEVALRLVDILTKENVKFTTEDIGLIVNQYHPDIRKVINFAQQCNDDGTLKISKENAMETDQLNKLVNILKNPSQPGAFNEIRKIVVDMDPNSLDVVYSYLFEKVEDYAKGKEGIVILELGDSITNSVSVIPAVRDITFLACMYKLLKHLK